MKQNYSSRFPQFLRPFCLRLFLDPPFQHSVNTKKGRAANWGGGDRKDISLYLSPLFHYWMLEWSIQKIRERIGKTDLTKLTLGKSRYAVMVYYHDYLCYFTH